MRAKFEECKGVLTICTGSVALARADVLDGKEVCTNKAMLKILEEETLLNEKVKWVRDKRWNLDGKIWSSAGVTAGIDLAVEFARREFGDVVPTGLRGFLNTSRTHSSRTSLRNYILGGS